MAMRRNTNNNRKPPAYRPTLPTCPPAYLPTYLPAYPPTCLPACLPPHLPTYLPTYLAYRPPTLPTLPTYLPACLPTFLITYQPACPPTCLTTCASACLSFCLPACLPARRPACLHARTQNTTKQIYKSTCPVCCTLERREKEWPRRVAPSAEGDAAARRNATRRSPPALQQTRPRRNCPCKAMETRFCHITARLRTMLLGLPPNVSWGDAPATSLITPPSLQIISALISLFAGVP